MARPRDEVADEPRALLDGPEDQSHRRRMAAQAAIFPSFELASRRPSRTEGSPALSRIVAAPTTAALKKMLTK